MILFSVSYRQKRWRALLKYSMFLLEYTDKFQDEKIPFDPFLLFNSFCDVHENHIRILILCVCRFIFWFFLFSISISLLFVYIKVRKARNHKSPSIYFYIFFKGFHSLSISIEACHLVGIPFQEFHFIFHVKR